jgi:hypothetical protein
LIKALGGLEMKLVQETQVELEDCQSQKGVLKACEYFDLPLILLFLNFLNFISSFILFHFISLFYLFISAFILLLNTCSQLLPFGYSEVSAILL